MEEPDRELLHIVARNGEDGSECEAGRRDRFFHASATDLQRYLLDVHAFFNVFSLFLIYFEPK